jgi:hypothetical protein
MGGGLCDTSTSCTDSDASSDGDNLSEFCEGEECADDQSVDTPVMISGAFLTANCQEEPISQNSQESVIACRMEDPKNPGQKAEAEGNVDTDWVIYDAFNRPLDIQKTAAPAGSPWQWYFSVPKDRAVGAQAKLAIADKSSNQSTYQLAAVTPDKSRPATDFSFINEVNIGLGLQEKSFHLGNLQPFSLDKLKECMLDPSFFSLRVKNWHHGTQIKIPFTVVKAGTVVGMVLEGVCGAGSTRNRMTLDGIDTNFLPSNGNRAVFEGQTLNPGTYSFSVHSAELVDNDYDDFIVSYIKFKSSAPIQVNAAGITVTAPPVQQQVAAPQPQVTKPVEPSMPTPSPTPLTPEERAALERSATATQSTPTPAP